LYSISFAQSREKGRESQIYLSTHAEKSPGISRGCEFYFDLQHNYLIGKE
jgi:hypothetical protein